MRIITIDELESTDMNNVCVLDIRQKKDFDKGSVRNAVHLINIPFDELSPDNELLPESMPIYVICYKGESSAEAAKMLENAGFDAHSVDGGYREYRRNWLLKNIEI